MTTFKVGDRVRVLGTPEAKEATAEMRGWEPGMDKVVGQVGTVYSIDCAGCRVEFPAPIDYWWHYAPESLELVEDEKPKTPEIGKVYRTPSGNKFRVHALDGAPGCEVIGALFENGHWSADCGPLEILSTLPEWIDPHPLADAKPGDAIWVRDDETQQWGINLFVSFDRAKEFPIASSAIAGLLPISSWRYGKPYIPGGKAGMTEPTKEMLDAWQREWLHTHALEPSPEYATRGQRNDSTHNQPPPSGATHCCAAGFAPHSKRFRRWSALAT